MKGKSESSSQVIQTPPTTTVVDNKAGSKAERKTRAITKDLCTAGICTVAWKPQPQAASK